MYAFCYERWVYENSFYLKLNLSFLNLGMKLLVNLNLKLNWNLYLNFKLNLNVKLNLKLMLIVDS